MRTKINGTNVLQYHSDPDNVTDLLNQIHKLKHRYGSRVNIATIPPALLVNYLKFHNSELDTDSIDTIYTELGLEQQQQDLEKDVSTINDKVVQLNKTFRTQTINWAEKAYKNSIKNKKPGKAGSRVSKLSTTVLQDGVHCSKEKQPNWYSRVKDVLLNLYQDNNSETESWDYKRGRENKAGSGSGQPSDPSPPSEQVEPNGAGGGSSQPSEARPKIRSVVSKAGSGNGQPSERRVTRASTRSQRRQEGTHGTKRAASKAGRGTGQPSRATRH